MSTGCRACTTACTSDRPSSCWPRGAAPPWRSPAPNIVPGCTTTNATASAGARPEPPGDAMAWYWRRCAHAFAGLARIQQKHALGLDPGVDTGFASQSSLRRLRRLICGRIRANYQSKLSLRQIEKMPPCLVLGLNDPGVRVEPDFLDQTLFHGRFRHGFSRRRRKNALDRPAVVIDRLRCRHVQHGIAVEQRHLDEHRAGFFGAAPAYRAEYSLGLAAAQISRHPNAGFQSHGLTIGQHHK